MNCSSHSNKRAGMVIRLVVVLGILASAHGFSLGDASELLAVHRRSTMDLAIMQVYGLCDGDKNGVFTKAELPCVQRVLGILLRGR
ncbi:hypothetical protein BsWGS_00984 [Bradybaena similaris]